MSDNEETPCIRGCEQASMIEGEPAKPKPAKHGHLCNSCFYRMRHALALIPDLMANMRLKIVPGCVANYETDRVSGGGGGSPAPLRIDPLDASDSLFAKMVSWTEVVGGELKTAQPSVAVWINFREVQGSKPVTPRRAHEIASQLTSWFEVRLDQIAASDLAAAFHDDLCFGWEESRGVFTLSGAYGVEPRPLRAADKRECPVCGRKEVFVKWPDKLDPDVAIICGRCKWVAEPEKYGHYAELFKRA
jgi:hypothetical protein